MNAAPVNVVPFELPKKPKVTEKEHIDQRKFVVVPIRAATDPQLTHGMLKTLMLICSYMNRSGITWVSQKKLSEDLKVSQQAISRQLVKLVSAGYLEIMRKPKPGERTTTWRVIFDASIKAEDAIAITSAIEDTRPPYMKEQQMQDMTPDPQGQKRVAQAIAKVLKKPVTKKEPTMPKTGQTRTVQKMHEEIAKAGKKRQSKATHIQPPEVVPQPVTKPVDNSVQIQPPEVVQDTTPRGCIEHTKEHSIEVVYKGYLTSNLLVQLAEHGIDRQVAEDNLAHLLEAYRIEGLTPNPDRLVDEILQLAKVGL